MPRRRVYPDPLPLYADHTPDGVAGMTVGCLCSGMGTGGLGVPLVQDAWGVRRLTVAEIARLQGFDDPAPVLFPPGTPYRAQLRMLGNAACPHLTAVLARML